MADWLRRSDTQDPAVILERKEERTCKGCVYNVSAWSKPWCIKHGKPADKKCAKGYKESE